MGQGPTSEGENRLTMPCRHTTGGYNRIPGGQERRLKPSWNLWNSSINMEIYRLLVKPPVHPFQVRKRDILEQQGLKTLSICHQRCEAWCKGKLG
jgi:hypothetical protein